MQYLYFEYVIETMYLFRLKWLNKKTCQKLDSLLDVDFREILDEIL